MYEKNVELFKTVEQKFAKSISMLGEINFSDKNQDMFEHWDVSLSLKIDVKAMKKTNRSDDKPNENIHYIELKNVNGNKGWLYGEANYFAFETEDYWIMVDKGKLQELIKNKCKDKQWCEKPELYKLYTRKGRHDVITLVKTLDLMYLSDKVINK